MRSFVALLLTILFVPALASELVTQQPKAHPVFEIVDPSANAEHGNLRHRRQCSPSAFTTKEVYQAGEQIKVIINICQASSAEWFGIWAAGTNPGTAPALNWQMTCGGQACRSPQNIGGYMFGMDINTLSNGSGTWPLPNGSYVIYYLSPIGMFTSSAFSIAGGSSSTSPSVPAVPPPPIANPNAKNVYQPLNRAITIACAGDSLTFGRSRVGPGDDYPTQLATMLSQVGSFALYNFGRNAMIAAQNTGVSYDRTGQFGGSVYIQPDIYLLMIGTNDVREWTGGFAAGLTNLVQQAKAASSRVILAIPPWVQGTCCGITNDGLVSRVIPEIRNVAASQQVPLVDMYSITVNQPSYYAYDGLHPNRQGYAAIAQTWYNAIQCNQNGICEVGETCSSCPSDCFVNC